MAPRGSQCNACAVGDKSTGFDVVRTLSVPPARGARKNLISLHVPERKAVSSKKAKMPREESGKIATDVTQLFRERLDNDGSG